MIVCHCKVVNDKQIRELIDSDARSVREIGARCGAGSDCGSCVRAIHEMLGQPGERPVVLA